MSHSGPVTIRFSSNPKKRSEDRYSVLCPLGHLVTGGSAGPDFAGSAMQAKISAHQNGGKRWEVECDGAVA